MAASNGTDFLVVWQERLPSESYTWAIYARRVSSTGALGTLVRLDAPGASNDTDPSVAWAGNNRYVVTWQNSTSGSIQMAYLDGSGNYVGASLRTLTSPATYAQVAADRNTGQAMVVYRAGPSVMGRTVDVASDMVGNARAIGQQGSDVLLGLPAVAFEPRLGGWLVSWNATNEYWQSIVRYAALNVDGTPRRVKDGLGPAAPRYDLTAVTPVGSANHSLACSSTTTDFAKCDGLATSSSQLHLAQLFMDDVPPWLGTLSVMTDTLMTVDADVPTATFAALTDGQYLAVTGTLTIGGDAGDSTSAVARVEVSEDGGPWQAATGAESWAYNWNVPPADGAHTLRVRAIDMVGNVGPDTAVTVRLDRTPPAVSFALPGNSIVGATHNAAGQWQVAMNGAVNDTGGIGTHNVATLLSPNGSGWQTATLAGNTWAVDYVLPAFGSDNQALSNPTGVYTFYARATDRLNNQTAPVPLALNVDTTPPVAALDYTGPSSTTITQTLTLSGVVTDPREVAAGVQQLEIAFTPAGQTPGAWANTTLAQSGEGITATTWSYPVPAGLEGTYQINLRGTDTRNNRNDDQADVESLARRD